jgi:hypothetical protein
VPERFQRGERLRKSVGQVLGSVKIGWQHEIARIAGVQFMACLPESCERVDEAAGSAVRAWAA